MTRQRPFTPLTEAQLVAASQITEEDQRRAAQTWPQRTLPLYAALLDATPDPRNADSS